MNKSIPVLARAMTIGIAAAMIFDAANAFAGNSSNDQSATDTAHKYVVQFSDLDLSRIEGATSLYSRIRNAARVVCDPLESREIGIAKTYRACMDKAVADAVASVNSPLLSQYHQLRTNGENAGFVQLAKAK